MGAGGTSQEGLRAPLGALVAPKCHQGLQGNPFGVNCDFRGSQPPISVSWQAPKGSEAVGWQWPSPALQGSRAFPHSHLPILDFVRWEWSRAWKGTQQRGIGDLLSFPRANPRPFPVLGGSDPPAQTPGASSLDKTGQILRSQLNPRSERGACGQGRPKLMPQGAPRMLRLTRVTSR